MKGWREDPEYQSTEEKFRTTGNIIYAVLAIGHWRSSRSFPLSPPDWALDACAELREKAGVGIEAIVNKTQGKRPTKADYERLDRVAYAHLHGSPATPRELFTELLREEGIDNEDQFEADLRRLINYYGIFADDKNQGVLNRHVNRVARKEAIARGFGKLSVKSRLPLASPIIDMDLKSHIASLLTFC